MQDILSAEEQLFCHVENAQEETYITDNIRIRDLKANGLSGTQFSS